MIVLISGDRNWSDGQGIQNVLEAYQQERGEIERLVEGGASGADRLGEQAARAMGIQVDEFPADWKTYGKAAGPVRNRQMLKEGNADVLFAFHDDLASSKGTADMIKAALKQPGLTVYHCRHREGTTGPIDCEELI